MVCKDYTGDIPQLKQQKQQVLNNSSDGRLFGNNRHGPQKTEGYWVPI